MRHRWWLMDWLIDWLEKEVDRDPLIREGSFSTFRTWRQKVARGKIVSKFLKQQDGDFYAMMKVAEDVDIFSFYDNNSPTDAKINFGWEHQTEARRRFGQVFPESVERSVRTNGTKVGRTYTWRGDQDGVSVNIIVGFWREAVDGEVVDGCRITLRRHMEGPFTVEREWRLGQVYASASCPMKR